MGLFRKSAFHQKIDEYHKWLQEEAERQRQRQVPKNQDPNSEENLDRQLEQWKEEARRINGWKK